MTSRKEKERKKKSRNFTDDATKPSSNEWYVVKFALSKNMRNWWHSASNGSVIITTSIVRNIAIKYDYVTLYYVSIHCRDICRWDMLWGYGYLFKKIAEVCCMMISVDIVKGVLFQLVPQNGGYFNLSLYLVDCRTNWSVGNNKIIYTKKKRNKLKLKLPKLWRLLVYIFSSHSSFNIVPCWEHLLGLFFFLQIFVWLTWNGGDYLDRWINRSSSWIWSRYEYGDAKLHL